MRGLLLALALLVLAARAGAEPPAVIAADAAYPEGPLWRGEGLYYAEMTRDRVMRWQEDATGVFWRATRCGPTAIAPFGEAGFAILCHLAGKLALVGPNGDTRRWVERDGRGLDLNNPNDVAADGAGGIYFSDAGPFHPGAPAAGKVYYLGPAGAPRKLVWDLHYANGVTLDRPRARLLVSEHLGRKIRVYPILGPGRIGPGEVLVDLANALPESELADPLVGPDGLEVDRHGRLLFCVYGTGRVMMLDTRGRLSTVATLPERYITNLALDPSGTRLAVAAARDNTTRPYPGRVVEIPLPPLE